MPDGGDGHAGPAFFGEVQRAGDVERGPFVHVRMEAAQALGPRAADATIVERHHRRTRRRQEACERNVERPLRGGCAAEDDDAARRALGLEDRGGEREAIARRNDRFSFFDHGRVSQRY